MKRLIIHHQHRAVDMMKWAILALFLFVGAANAQTPSSEVGSETDLALAIQAVQTSAAQLGVAAKGFVRELARLREQQAIADYWRDACVSTPGCGKPGNATK